MARRVRITFEGLNLARTICALSQNFSLFDVSRRGRECRITLNSTDLSKVVAFLGERCYNVTDIQKIGWNFVLFFMKKHFLLPVFCLLAVLSLFVSSNFCWEVQVCGDFSDEAVMSALDECNIGIGSELFDFSADELENRLCTKLDAMYAVVTRKGSVLYVNAVKKKTADEPIDMHSRRDIVATADGTVTELLCEQGYPVVAVGDFVHSGDVLIEGLRIYNDGTSEDVYALGKVVLELSSEGFAEFCGTATQTEDTGRTFCANSVELFGKSYGKLPSFESFRTEQTSVSLAPLNLTVRHIIYYETCRVTRTATFEECLDEMKSLALQEALQNANFVVKSVSYRITSAGVFATVCGVAEIM